MKKRKFRLGNTGLMLSFLLLILVFLYLATPLFDNGVKGRSLTLASSSLCSDAGGMCAESCPDDYVEEPSLTSECNADLPYCGNGYCDFDEDCSICESDCGSCTFTCDDETPYDQCTPDLTKYCDAGSLIDNCVAGCPTCPESYECNPTTRTCQSIGPSPSGFCGDSICAEDEDCDLCPEDCLSASQICCSGTSITPTCTTGSCPSGQTCNNPGSCSAYCQSSGGSTGSSPMAAKTGEQINPSTAAIAPIPSTEPIVKCCITAEPRRPTTITPEDEMEGERFESPEGEIRYVVDLTTTSIRTLDDVETQAVIEIITDTTGSVASYITTILEKTDNAVTLDIDGITVNINKGETKQIDLDNDGDIDLMITVRDITDTIDFTFEKKLAAPPEEDERVVAGIQRTEPGFESKYFKKVLLVVIIILAGAILLLLLKENIPRGGKKKPSGDLDDILSKANADMRKGKFDSSLKSYSLIHSMSKKIPNKTPELEKEISKVTNALNLYVKIAQAKTLAKSKNFPKLKETLENVHFLKESLRDEYPLLVQHADNSYESLLKHYSAYMSRKNFFKTLAQIHIFLEQNKKEEAFNLYPELRKAYTSLVRKGEYNMNQMLYGRMKDVSVKLYSKDVEKQKAGKNIKKPYFELRKLLQENDYEKAFSLYKNIYSV